MIIKNIDEAVRLNADTEIYVYRELMNIVDRFNGVEHFLEILYSDPKERKDARNAIKRHKVKLMKKIIDDYNYKRLYIQAVRRTIRIPEMVDSLEIEDFSTLIIKKSKVEAKEFEQNHICDEVRND